MKKLGLVTIKGSLPPSEVVKILRKVRNVLNRMGKIIKYFRDFYFSSFRENSSNDVTKMTVPWKIKICNMNFISFQPIADLSC